VPMRSCEYEGSPKVQVTLQLQPKDAAVIKRIALDERRTPRRVAQELLRGAIANQTNDSGGSMT